MKAPGFEQRISKNSDNSGGVPDMISGHCALGLER